MMTILINFASAHPWLTVFFVLSAIFIIGTTIQTLVGLLRDIVLFGFRRSNLTRTNQELIALIDERIQEKLTRP